MSAELSTTGFHCFQIKSAPFFSLCHLDLRVRGSATYLDGVHDDSEAGNCKLVGVPQVMVIQVTEGRRKSDYSIDPVLRSIPAKTASLK